MKAKAILEDGKIIFVVHPQDNIDLEVYKLMNNQDIRFIDNKVSKFSVENKGVTFKYKQIF